MDRTGEVRRRAKRILIEIEDLEKFIEDNFTEKERDIIYGDETHVIIGDEAEAILWRLIELTELDFMNF